MYPDDFVFDSIEKLDSLSPNKTSFFWENIIEVVFVIRF